MFINPPSLFGVPDDTSKRNRKKITTTIKRRAYYTMSSPQTQPVARWLSIDDLRVATRRNSEIYASQFCEELVNSGALDPVMSHASDLRNAKCTIDMTRIAIGGFSVLFNVLVDGGHNDKSWVVRIRLPRQGESLTPQQRHSESLLLESEIATMRYVRENSSIPVPDVYGYDTSFTNPLGHPYMFLEMVVGTAAMWATMSCTLDQRHKLIRNMASIVHELGTLTFPAIGQLRCSATGPGKVAVGQLVSRRGEIVGPFSTSTEYYHSRARLIVDHLKSGYNEPAATPGVDKNTHSTQEDKQQALAVRAATILAERSIIDGTYAGPFPLKHPDLSFQNVLVDENFVVVAVLDWSFASTVPPEEFSYFHTPATPRLPFVVQHSDEEVTADHQYFLTCLEEHEGERNPSLHQSCFFRSCYSTEVASYLAAFDGNRPRITFMPKLSALLNSSSPAPTESTSLHSTPPKD
jgi:aminoglycoside phosphotransferase (APT) family kinase protein